MKPQRKAMWRYRCPTCAATVTVFLPPVAAPRCCKCAKTMALDDEAR